MDELISGLAVVTGVLYIGVWLYLLHCFQRIVVDDLLAESKKLRRRAAELDSQRKRT